MSEQEEHPARSEAARSLVSVAVMAAAIPLMAWLERRSHDPDAARRLRMNAAKTAERVLAGAAGRCWAAAERARLAYERERP